MQTDTRLEFAELCLQTWGACFPLESREREPNATNIIYRLAYGDLRGHSGTPWQAIRAEDAVRAVFQAQREQAIALRAYYCGRGRRSVERWEKFRDMIGRHVPRRVYFELVESGKLAVCAELYQAGKQGLRL